MLIERAKAMRREPTPFEAKLWYALRAKRFYGARFRQQVAIGHYIVDFACRQPKMLVIEIDGDTHAEREKYDEQRTAELVRKGYQVLRFTNTDVRTNCEAVLTIIAEALDSPLSPTLSPEGEREQDAA